MLSLIALILSLIFAALAASGLPEHPRFRWLGASLAFLALALLLGRLVGSGPSLLGPTPP